MSGGYARITASSYNLLHCPELSFRHGSTPEAERAARPESEYVITSYSIHYTKLYESGNVMPITPKSDLLVR